jgi:benzoate/toluate 1,2-dioxygenase reductase subunit
VYFTRILAANSVGRGDALSQMSSNRDYVLPCILKPRSDLVLKIASTSEVAKTQSATYVGEITEFTRLSPSTVSFAIHIPNRYELAFLLGPYVNIAVPGTDESRSYSFSNAPDDKSLTFLVKLTRGGVMTTYLDERAKVGDQLTFTGPNGSFFLREGQGPALLIAGGTGLAPILSILRKMWSGGARPMPPTKAPTSPELCSLWRVATSGNRPLRNGDVTGGARS